MELYQLENFVAVVEERSFTRAAERVFRTQGAVSVAIRKLENEIGLPLLIRDTHECLPTDAGHELLQHARCILGMRDQMTSRMDEFKNLTCGRVRIAAHESVAEYLLPPALAKFSVQYPDLQIEARMCDGHEIARLVTEREVDVGFGISQPMRQGLRSEALLVDPLVLVVPPSHCFSSRKVISIQELHDERFVMHSRHTTMIETLQKAFASYGISAHVVAKLWKFETIKYFVREGGGIAVVPFSVVAQDTDHAGLVLVRIQEFDISRTIEVVYRENEPLQPAPTALLDLLRRWPWHNFMQFAA